MLLNNNNRTRYTGLVLRPEGRGRGDGRHAPRPAAAPGPPPAARTPPRPPADPRAFMITEYPGLIDPEILRDHGKEGGRVPVRRTRARRRRSASAWRRAGGRNQRGWTAAGQGRGPAARRLGLGSRLRVRQHQPAEHLDHQQIGRRMSASAERGAAGQADTPDSGTAHVTAFRSDCLFSEGVEHLDSGQLKVLDVAGDHGHAMHPRRCCNERVDHREGLRVLLTAPGSGDREGDR
jgi:hypothetical protein